MTAFVAWWRVCHTVATPARVWCGTYQGVRCGRLWTAAKSTIQTPRWSTAPVLHTSTAPVVSWGSSAAVWVTSRQTCSQSVSTKLKKDQSYTKIFCCVRFGKCKGQWKPLRCPLMLLFCWESVREVFETFYIPSLMDWFTLALLVFLWKHQLLCEDLIRHSCILSLKAYTNISNRLTIKMLSCWCSY